MRETALSPERPSVKVTYLNRQKKRKRKIEDGTDDLSDQESACGSETTSVSASKVPTVSMKTPLTKAPDSKGPKKIEFNLPGPAPKRLRQSSEEDVSSISPSRTAKKSLHSRSSSLSLVVQQVEAATASPKLNKKPSSVASIRSTKQPSISISQGTHDTDIDDNASIADSTISVSAIRRTEDERLAYFRNQPDLGKLEDHRAECTRCNKFISLGKQRKYTVRPWEDHRKRCDAQVPGSMPEREDSDQDDETKESTPRNRALIRKMSLESDPDVLSIKPDEVQCRKCQKWIRLSILRDYVLNNWLVHKKACCNPVPSSRVATATRKLQIVNDPQAKSFSPSHVECIQCEERIVLTGEGAYNLSNWETHKESGCTGKPSSTEDIPQHETSPEVVYPMPSPPSSASTESTVIGSDRSAPAGTKRPREDEVTDDDQDTRPSNRPRNESYEPPEKEAPSALGWFMLPLKAFVRGFRESLKTS